MMSRTVAPARPSWAKTRAAAARMVSRFCALVSSRRPAGTVGLGSIPGTCAVRDVSSICRADRVAQFRKTITLQAGQKLLLDTSHQARAMEGQGGVELHQR